jgi:hypothetical protein
MLRVAYDGSPSAVKGKIASWRTSDAPIPVDRAQKGYNSVAVEGVTARVRGKMWWNQGSSGPLFIGCLCRRCHT